MTVKRIKLAILPRQKRIELYEKALQLHREKGWESRAISKCLGVATTTVQHWIKGETDPRNKYYPVDSWKPLILKTLSLEEKFKLYDKALELRKAHPKWGARRIARYLQLNHATVATWIYCGQSPRTRYKFPNLSETKELSYIIGTFYSDGHISKKDYHLITLHVKDKDFAIEFARCLAVVCKRSAPPINSPPSASAFYWVKIHNRLLAEFLGDKNYIPTRLRRVIEQFPSSFLRGIFDGDGTGSGALGLGNSNLELLLYCRDLLYERFGMSFKKERISTKKGTVTTIKGRKTKSTKHCYVVQYSACNDILTFLEEIGFTIKRKQENLRKFAKEKGWKEKRHVHKWCKNKDKKTVVCCECGKERALCRLTQKQRAVLERDPLQNTRWEYAGLGIHTIEP